MTISDPKPAAPVRKWTIVNDEWVQIWCQIVRKGSGYVETPLALSPYATSQVETK